MGNLVRRPNAFFDDINRLFNVWEKANDDTTTGAMSNWHPSVDIKETPSSFVLLADLPGISPEEIEVSMEHNILTIKGERETVNEESGDDYSRTERVSGSFFRRFTLPETADSEKIHAKSKHGVLELTIPKVEKAKPKKVEIKVDSE